MLLRARLILPISQPPIADGAVMISHDRIHAVGQWNDLRRGAGNGSEEVVDLGDSLILPGLINAHCHLDYTRMAGKIPPPKSFPDWIKALLALKAHWSYTEYAESWLAGAKMLLQHGVTSVADIEAVPELLPEVWNSTPLRIFSFLEMTGIKSRRAPAEILREAVEKIADLRSEKNSAGLSPHAPYSTSPDLLRLAAEVARQRNWRVTTHVAESAAEFDMMVAGRGALFDWLQPQRDMSDCGLGSPVGHLVRADVLGPNFLAVHANYLTGPDIRLLAETGSHVVHCPRSHAYFGHDPFPWPKLRAAGANVCLGTDSLVSTLGTSRRSPELNLFEEMRTFASVTGKGCFEEIVRMATVRGARALGAEGLLGELKPGSFADVIVLPVSAACADAYEQVVRHEGPVRASMIGGRWAITP